MTTGVTNFYKNGKEHDNNEEDKNVKHLLSKFDKKYKGVFLF